MANIDLFSTETISADWFQIVRNCPYHKQSEKYLAKWDQGFTLVRNVRE